MAELSDDGERCWHVETEPDDEWAHWATCMTCGAHLHNREYEPGGWYENYCDCPRDEDEE